MLRKKCDDESADKKVESCTQTPRIMVTDDGDMLRPEPAIWMIRYKAYGDVPFELYFPPGRRLTPFPIQKIHRHRIQMVTSAKTFLVGAMISTARGRKVQNRG